MADDSSNEITNNRRGIQFQMKVSIYGYKIYFRLKIKSAFEILAMPKTYLDYLNWISLRWIVHYASQIVDYYALGLTVFPF